ncbi:glycosyltransferase [Egibacter rhizosphaerae]|uniref:Glycosyltransferase n=1 Tax=Egibacter rhizosphaerae TaxID=1670831 RepID=A0A411YH67_9ACTN|nr:glycosyltransferase [Egibacter rhizosphaerae]QBI20685.1 glycosyltransferase [Egibacter rhizosphaerae]
MAGSGASHEAGSRAGAASRPDAVVLVLSTVHQADDPRLRYRTVAVVAADGPVRYATRPPAPATVDDHEWRALPGGRPRRWLAAVREAWRRDVALVSVHDPELIPLALATRYLRRRPVIVDVHEDVPAQIATKAWLPRPLRRPLAWLAAGLLRAAERGCVVTLAEPNYADRFRRAHPVLPNYPDPASLPQAAPSDGWFVYVGDVTEVRGARLAVAAVGRLEPPRRLRLIGRCASDLATVLRADADAHDVELDLPGFVPHPHAMARVATAEAGLSPLADIPNYRRSLPTKTLEYLGAGVPVVASDLPGTREVVGDLPGVRLVAAPGPGPPAPHDVQSWAEALRAVRADPGVRARALTGRDAVRARFAWPSTHLRRIYADARTTHGR